jgi:hypothetical protein
MGLSMGFIPQSEGSLTQCCPTQNIVNVNTKANTISIATRMQPLHTRNWRLLATIGTGLVYARDIPVESAAVVVVGS